MKKRLTNSIGLLAFMALMISGCGYPQAGPENIDLLASLRTALSAQNEDWLDRNVEKIEARRAEGVMSDEAYEAFQSIVEEAKAGEWKKAEQMCISYQESQRPSGQVSHDHGHDHGHGGS